MGEISQFLSLGVGGALAVFVILVWRQDRRGWIAQYKEDRESSEKRMMTIAADFRVIVQENTQALTKLSDALENKSFCPMVNNRDALWWFPEQIQAEKPVGDETGRKPPLADNDRLELRYQGASGATEKWLNQQRAELPARCYPTPIQIRQRA